MRFLSRWTYKWKINQDSPDVSDLRNLILTENNSSKFKTFLKQHIGLLRCYTSLFITMGLLWLLAVAIICCTTNLITASSEGNNGSTKHTAELIGNNTKQIKSGLNSAFTAQNTSQGRINNSTDAIREKRGTPPKESTLEKREVSKFRLSSWAMKIPETPDAEKRAKFSSWGGKRAESNEIKGIKRAKFSSWGGKRDYSDNELGKSSQVSSWTEAEDADDMNENKRAKFNSWAGKRTGSSEDDKRAKFSSWAGKRGKFNSWAGKRSDLEMAADNQHYFNSWEDGQESSDQNNYFLNEDKRAKFSSWAGKRNPDYLGTSWNNVSPDNHIKYYSGGIGDSGNENIMKLWQDLMSRKRARFSSWAGKRSEENTPDISSLVTTYADSDMHDKRAKFSSWAGKRDDLEKRKFSSWGGKRSVNESSGDMIDEKESYPSIIVKRSVFTWNSPSIAYKRKPVFSSWGGKRNDAHIITIRSLPIQRVLISGGNDRTWGSLMRPIRRGPDFYAWGGKRSV